MRVFHACEYRLFIIAENGLRNTTKLDTRDWFYKFSPDLPFRLFPSFSALLFVHILGALQSCSESARYISSFMFLLPFPPAKALFLSLPPI